MKVLFLDIDGVLNHNHMSHHNRPTPTEPLPIPIATECMNHLNRLIAETGAKIVISSSWRLFVRWQDLGPALLQHGLVGEVIGETPDLPNNTTWLTNWHTRKGSPFAFDQLERGWEIAEWLAVHPDVTEFVILDDCSDMAELKPWLALTEADEGLVEADVLRARWLMARSALGLEKARELALGANL